MPSPAVTRTLSAPTSPAAGVPLKVPVAASKLSHAGKLLPSAKEALKMRASLSESEKLAAGTTKLKAFPVLTFWSAIGAATVGAWFVGSGSGLFSSNGGNVMPR